MLPASCFPYPRYRPFQDELIHRIYTAERLICSIPSGVGKSVSALCGFLASREENEKIVVLTRTKSQARVFLHEMARISKHLRKPFLTLHLRSKQELCKVFNDREISYEEFVQLCRLKEDCEHRKRLFENAALIEALAENIAVENLNENKYVEYKDFINKISEYGCPYLALQRLLKYADVVVASYIYLLHPFLKDSFLTKLCNSMNEILLILDEAHNLQSLDLLGRQLSRETVDLAAKELNYDFSNVYAMFEGENTELHIQDIIDPRKILFLYERGIEVLQRRLVKGKKISYTFRVASFLDSAARMQSDSSWMFFRQDNKLFLKPAVPLEILNPLKEAKKLLLMSATLTPPEGYKILYGLEDAEVFSLPNIFPRENQAYFGIKNGLNSSLKLREEAGEKLWERYARVIQKIYAESPKTSLVFFPSYEIMENVEKYMDTEALAEPNASYKLDDFWEEIRNKERKIVFGVSGGKLSEGVEYIVENGEEKESVISSIMVAGFPFPVPDFEMEVKRMHYEQRFGPGKAFLLLSVLPMVNKVLQSIGRAVRSESDRAAIIFLDDRIDYFKYFPEEIRHELQICSLENLPKEVGWFHRCSGKSYSS